MRRPWLAVAAMAWLCAVVSPALAEDAEARYQTLLAVAKTDTAPVDWAALRLAYADRPSFNVFGAPGEDALQRDMRQAINDGDTNHALEMSRKIIAEDYVDPEAHLVAAAAYDRQGSPSDAAAERRIGQGLVRSIMTVDGTSPATAFNVITVKEEYTVIAAMGRHVTEQSLNEIDGHKYDVLETTNEKGEAKSYYFLIDRIWALESKAFAPRSMN